MFQAKKRAQCMRGYLFSDRYDDLENLMTGGLKPEYYTRKRFLIFWGLDQVLNG